MSEIKVSVVCNTYNHVGYVRQTLDSMVSQKTDFPFEILIHDDASTDNTQEIICEFEQKYPDIVKPIYQTENQYSKHVKIAKTIQVPRAEGKYIAYCEGDDYWTDENKLQKQFEALEKHPEVDCCAHGAVKLHEEKPFGKVTPKDTECVLTAEEVIAGGGGYVATNSLMWRKEAFLMDTPMSDYLSFDFVWQIQGALRGGIYYLPDIMSAYRVGVRNSWTDRVIGSREKYRKHAEQVRKLFELTNEYTDYKYDKAIKEKMLYNEFYTHCKLGEYREARDKKYRSIYSKLPLSRKIRFNIKCLFSKRK